MDQIPYRGFNGAEHEFADNPDPRAPCLLLIDTSGSMAGQRLDELNSGLRKYREAVLRDSMTSRRVEVALITFGGNVSVKQDFVVAGDFHPPLLEASGNTPIAQAIIHGTRLLEDRKAIYKANGINYYRPWIFLITDGEPTDPQNEWQLACEAVRRGEERKMFAFFAIGVGEANYTKLRELSAARAPFELKNLAFEELFTWLSNSQANVSRSQPGAQVAVTNPSSFMMPT